MAPRRQKTQIRNASLCLVIPSMVICAGLIFWPLPSTDSVPGSFQSATAQDGDITNPDIQIDVTASQAVWQRSLLAWQLPKTSSVELNATPGSEESVAGVRLVGTIIEPGATFAMIVDQTGTIDLRTEGSALALQPGGMRLEKIEADSVVVSYLGDFRTLRLTELEEFFDEEQQDSNEMTMEMNSVAPDNLDEELDWLNGALPMPPKTPSEGSR